MMKRCLIAYNQLFFKAIFLTEKSEHYQAMTATAEYG